MSKIIVFGNNPTDKTKNKTIRGISFTAFLVHAILNTAFVSADLDWSQLMLKVTLMRGGKAHIVCQDNMRNLGASTNYFNPLFLSALDFTSGLTQLVLHTAGAYEQSVATLTVDFGGVINVHGGDELIAEVQCPLGMISTTNINSTTSNIYMDWILGVGHEFATPFIKGYNLQASEQNQEIAMGDNIVDVVLLNYDKTDAKTASAVVSTLTLKNNKYTPTYTYNQLLARQMRLFTTSALALGRLQSFSIYDNDMHDLDGCSLNLQLNSSNVNAGKNVVMYRGYEFSPIAFERGHSLEREHKLMKVGKVYGHDAVGMHVG